MPQPDTTAPVRLLARWDAALLSHRDRTRILPDAFQDHVVKRVNGDFLPTYLVDGLVAGTWSHAIARDRAVVTLHPLGDPPTTLPGDLEVEATRMLRLLAPAARHHNVEVSDAAGGRS